jgi:hypothetical protein
MEFYRRRNGSGIMLISKPQKWGFFYGRENEVKYTSEKVKYNKYSSGSFVSSGKLSTSLSKYNLHFIFE